MGEPRQGVAIVAHPDDETLWAGGTLLLHPTCHWTVVTLTRKGDPDRAPRFARALAQLGAAGALGDLDDGPEQRPLDAAEVEEAILDLLPAPHYDLVLTHGLWGEYTRHRRHEEVAAAVLSLRDSGRLSAEEVWMFAYGDNGGRHLPRPIGGSNIYTCLPADIWKRKYRLITEVYGFAPDSFEARTTPRHEAFWIV